MSHLIRLVIQFRRLQLRGVDWHFANCSVDMGDYSCIQSSVGRGTGRIQGHVWKWRRVAGGTIERCGVNDWSNIDDRGDRVVNLPRYTNRHRVFFYPEGREVLNESSP